MQQHQRPKPAAASPRETRETAAGSFSPLQIEEYAKAKAAILRGEVYYGLWRGSGRSTALHDVIHEKHKGEAWVALPNRNLERWFVDLYRRRYPEDTIPKTTRADRSLRGVSVYVDNYGMFDAEQIRNVEHALIGGIA